MDRPGRDCPRGIGIADHVPVAAVLHDWTHTLSDELAAVHLADLARGPTTYRVFLLPDALQCDLSMTPAAQFRPAGPRFRLLFGQTAAGGSEVPTPAVAGDLFGWGVIYVRQTRSAPVTLLATYRSDGGTQGTASFDALLHALYREHLSETLHVSPLVRL